MCGVVFAALGTVVSACQTSGNGDPSRRFSDGTSAPVTYEYPDEWDQDGPYANGPFLVSLHKRSLAGRYERGNYCAVVYPAETGSVLSDELLEYVKTITRKRLEGVVGEDGLTFQVREVQDGAGPQSRLTAEFAVAGRRTLSSSTMARGRSWDVDLPWRVEGTMTQTPTGLVAISCIGSGEDTDGLRAFLDTVNQSFRRSSKQA